MLKPDYALLQKVFMSCKAGYVYEPDLEAWGKTEFWAGVKARTAQRTPDGRLHGDCDDFAILCKDRLAEVGLEGHLVACIVPEYGGHLVTVIDGWIFDCRQNSVIARDMLDYNWLAECKDGKWYEVTNA